MTPANPDALADALAEFQRRNGFYRREIEELLMDFGALVLATAEARAAQLQAEVEAKDRRIATLTEALEPFAWFGEVATPDTTQTWAGVRHTERISTRFRHEHFRAARTALAARAATAREGQTHTPASGALKIEEADRG